MLVSTALAAFYFPARFRKGNIMRYAGYVRTSHEEKTVGYSLDAQTRAIQTWVQEMGGTLVKIYRDEGQSGRTANRSAFSQMLQDAQRKQFDAIVVHRFDRFSRNRLDSMAIKALLRHDFGIKIFSTIEPSEDSDGEMGALLEAFAEIMADLYSRQTAANLAAGKRERAMQGYQNNQAPYGYD